MPCTAMCEGISPPPSRTPPTPSVGCRRGRPPATRASRSRTCRPTCATSCYRRASRRTTSHRTITSEGAHLHACSHDHPPPPHSHTSQPALLYYLSRNRTPLLTTRLLPGLSRESFPLKRALHLYLSRDRSQESPTATQAAAAAVAADSAAAAAAATPRCSAMPLRSCSSPKPPAPSGGLPKLIAMC